MSKKRAREYAPSANNMQALPQLLITGANIDDWSNRVSTVKEGLQVPNFFTNRRLSLGFYLKINKMLHKL